MRQSKEILVLIVLFVGMAGFVLWYVADRRAKNRASPPLPAVAPQTAGQTPAGQQAGMGSAATSRTPGP
jgi:hypothetical protein